MRKDMMMRWLMWAVVAVMAVSAWGFTREDCCRGYEDDADNELVTFIFDNSLWGAKDVSAVEVRGSFTGWNPMPEFYMREGDESGLWVVTVPYSMVRMPGNSGRPEFKFVTNHGVYQNGKGRDFIPEGYIWGNGEMNNILVFEGEDFEEIRALNEAVNRMKGLEDFDLSTREGKEEIANFRLVPGTVNLFRSYHPYKWTKVTNETEPRRIEMVKELADEEGIRSVICLSEPAENNLQTYFAGGQFYTEEIPGYYREAIKDGRVLYVGVSTGSMPTSEEVFYNAGGNRFAAWIKEVVEWILSGKSEPPYQIHCRIGTDRTGMFSGVIAALCGATWDEIEEDFEKSGRMGIQEFRGGGLIRYAFGQLLGVEDVREVRNLADAVAEHYVKARVLSRQQVEDLRMRLGARYLLSGVNDEVAEGAEPVKIRWFRPTGVEVREDVAMKRPGIYILRREWGDGSVEAEKVVIR